MSDSETVKFDMDEQLKSIENYTEMVQQQVKQLVSNVEATDISDATQSVSKVESEVSQMLSDIEVHLVSEIEKINEQLQTLLPDDIKK